MGMKVLLITLADKNLLFYLKFSSLKLEKLNFQKHKLYEGKRRSKQKCQNQRLGLH